MEDPEQTELFDVFEQILSPIALERLRQGWQHLFRMAILKLLPAGTLAQHFHPDRGRPTKELYSMAGLLFVMEFRNWTHEEAVEAYLFNVDLQYALNLAPENQSLCRRTLERYVQLFRDDELAVGVMDDVTTELVRLLELDVSKQRLDSTHIESNMAKFGRIRLMATAISRFLVQVMRHDEPSYSRIRKSVRERYASENKGKLFGWKDLDEEAVNRLRQEVAEDLLYVVEKYRRNRSHNSRSTYTSLAKILQQQCELLGGKVKIREEPGGNIICNSSDPDATLDGHKGSGYQVQLCETYSEDNSVQLIIAATTQTACEHDSDAIDWLLDYYQDHGNMPEVLLADTAYGSDENFQKCAYGARWSSPLVPDTKPAADPSVKLVSPTSGSEPKPKNHERSQAEEPLTILDFAYDNQANRFTHCPAGSELDRSHFDKTYDKHDLIMLSDDCRGCPLKNRCPMQRSPMLWTLRVSGKELRLAQRRRLEKTSEFRDAYRRRSGVEATNSVLKRKTGLGRLRVRGRPAVTMSSMLKVAGWNLLRAASVRDVLAKISQAT